jgi:hypothetical protein
MHLFYDASLTFSYPYFHFFTYFFPPPHLYKFEDVKLAKLYFPILKKKKKEKTRGCPSYFFLETQKEEWSLGEGEAGK